MSKLTLKEQATLAKKTSFIEIVGAAIYKVAGEVTHEDPTALTFGDTLETMMDEHPNGVAVREQAQVNAHTKRLQHAQMVIASTRSMREAAQRGAHMIATGMVEDLEKVSPQLAEAVAQLLKKFLYQYEMLTGEELETIDNTIVATVREGWSAVLSGFSPYLEIPKALKASEAQEAPLDPSV